MKDIDKKGYVKRIEEIKNKLVTDDMTDWYDIQKCITKEEINDIVTTSKDIINNCDVFIVIGIGGSFLGAKMVIDALSSYFVKNKPEIIFAGTTLSSTYLSELKEYIKDKDVCINMISKSGSTLEPNLVFDYLMDTMNDKYSKEEVKNRVFITTDKDESILLDVANKNGYKKFYVPRNIGGRYSVLSPVGLLPIAVAGFNINKILDGATKANKEKAFEYAIIRDDLYRSGKVIESFTFYEEKLSFLGEWLKQLFAETQGKNNKAILPITTVNTRDLHSLGQYFQEGERILFETVINISTDIAINTKYNKTVKEINDIAVTSVAKAHLLDGVYSNIIEVDKLDEESIGYLIYFFELAAATGAYLLDVNPFDQPGVSKYKKIINESLGD
jgi:glucose-6-phosphate isomerase